MVESEYEVTSDHFGARAGLQSASKEPIPSIQVGWPPHLGAHLVIGPAKWQEVNWTHAHKLAFAE